MSRYEFEFTVSPVPPGPCRCPSRPCPIPAGWDAAHSDSDRPYTFEELERRLDAPHAGAYPDLEEYRRGFELWRALRRDDRLNTAEAEVRFAGLREAIECRFAEIEHDPEARFT